MITTGMHWLMESSTAGAAVGDLADLGRDNNGATQRILDAARSCLRRRDVGSLLALEAAPAGRLGQSGMSRARRGGGAGCRALRCLRELFPMTSLVLVFHLTRLIAWNAAPGAKIRCRGDSGRAGVTVSIRQWI
jgi:hypothetical protein